MKNIVFIAIMVFTVLTAGYSFSITNTQDNTIQYFSQANPILTIEHPVNDTAIFHYIGQNNSKLNTSQNLNQCGDIYCYEFSGLTYTQYSDNFTVSLNNTNKTLIQDNQDPTLENLSYTINKTTNQIELHYLPKDNSKHLESVELYEKNNNSYQFIKDITNTTQFNYSITNSTKKEFLYKLQDEALNTYEQSQTIEIEDFFKPVLENYWVTQTSTNSYKLSFNATDEQLKEYTISQGTVYLGEELNTTQFTTTLNLPFTQGTITLELQDNNNNTFEKNISLDSSIVVSSFNTIGNSNTYQFNSNSDTCTLKSINGDKKTGEFSQSGEEFSKQLTSLNQNEENTIEFQCSKDNFKKHFSKQYIYDTQSPQGVEVDITKQDDGSLELQWTNSKDNFGDIEYKIIRNGENLDTTKKTSYTDSLVEYPNSYEYTIKPTDEAGNTGSSNSVEQTPKKTSIDIEFKNPQETKQNSNTTTINLSTEKNLNLTVQVKNNDEINYEDTYTTNSQSLNVDVPLILGANEIEVIAQDNFSNQKEISKIVIYQKQETAQETIAQQEELSTINQTNNQTNSTQTQTIQNNQNSYWWVWFLLFIVALGIFVWIFIFNEDNLRKIQAKKARKDALNQRKRKEDEILGKSLDKVRQRRIQKQQEAAEKKRKKEEQKRREKILSTKYQQNKHKDIAQSSSNEVDFTPKKKKPKPKKSSSFKQTLLSKQKTKSNKQNNTTKHINQQLDNHLKNKQQQSKQTQQKPQEKTFEEDLQSTNTKQQPKQSFKEKFLTKKQPPKKDQFDEYITKQNETKSWDSTNSYRQSYQDKIEADKKQKEAEEQKKKQQEEEEKLKQQQQQQNTQQEEQKQQPQKKSWFKKTKKQPKEDKLSLDDYLSKKSKKRKMYFAEKEVEKRLKK